MCNLREEVKVMSDHNLSRGLTRRHGYQLKPKLGTVPLTYYLSA
jgi:hypothetical protein